MELIMNIPKKVKPEYVSLYKELFLKCRAETLKEEACLEYALFQSFTDSTEFHLFERWTSKEGQIKHSQTKHFKAYMEATKDIFVETKTKMIETYVCPPANR